MTTAAEFRHCYGSEWVPELALTLPDARIVYADTVALRRDFGVTDSDADGWDGPAWLLEHVAVLSRVQVAGQATHTPVRRTGAERRIHRAARYGRAALVPVTLPSGRSALFDVKGCGVRAGHAAVPGGANGLLTLGAALHELVLERLTRAALRHSGHPAGTVTPYAVVDLGVDVLDADGVPGEPAVLLVREARTRPRFQWGEQHPGGRTAAELLGIELTLRRYGISASCSGAIRFQLRHLAGRLEILRDGRVLPLDHRKVRRIARQVGFDGRALSIDGVNVQVTTGTTGPRQLIDFGCYGLARSFHRPLFASADRDCEALRGLFVSPGDAAWRGPVPELCLAGAFDHPGWAGLTDLVRGYRRDSRAPARLRHRLPEFLDAVARLPGPLA